MSNLKEIIKIPELILEYLIEEYVENYTDDEDFDLYFDEDWNPTELTKNYILINTILTDYDLENGYSNHDIIIQRVDDKKYFKGKYTYIYNCSNEYNTTFEEVFPIEKTITVYE